MEEHRMQDKRRNLDKGEEKRIKNVCVFASSSALLSDRYYEEAAELGRALSAAGMNMVFGGGRQGLMGAAAEGALEGEGRIIGIIPEKLHQPGVAHPRVHELIVTKTMHERKARMEDRSDAFIILPGGFGTLEELLEVITLKQLGYHDKAIIILNASGFYDHLLAQFHSIFLEHFTDEAFCALYDIAHTPKEAIDMLLGYLPGRLPEKIQSQMRA